MNYSNLSDVEFEYLCKDVMSRMLSKKLQRFGSGRDGGVDLADTSYPHKIIVQVKRYVKTDFDGLLQSLKKEIPKLEKLAPKSYYVCCSKELTPQNKGKIYELFSSYMDSTGNIITTLELDEFLESPQNNDILRKHYKLWLDSTNILTDILSNDIFVDSEALIANIEEEVKFFVRTHAFDEALSCLEKRNVLIIVGNPGVGKTITSKMLVMNYAANGYRVRYTTDGSDLKELKKSLAQDPKAKEVILLDDCFGQAYFNMKDTQEKELLMLIKYININHNKLLIMNSRISIYHEAGDRTPDFVKSFDQKEYRAYIIDIEHMSVEEKAKIFYNHLHFYGVPKEYFNNIRKDRNYRDIVKHINYNPRIIEFVCTPSQYKKVKSSSYADFVISCLDNPEQIWKNEYERRLGEVDRIFLTTLYSLSNTTVSFDMFKKCFEHRISSNPSLDQSINHFAQTLNRLSDSMIKIIDIRGVKMLSVANPSVNDFLREYISSNPSEKNNLIGGSNSVQQLKRLLDTTTYTANITELFKDKSILSFVFDNEKQKSGFITAWCAMHQIHDIVYLPYITDYLFHIRDIDMYESERALVTKILNGLFEKEFFDFYRLDKIICDINKLKDIFEDLQLDEVVEVIKYIDRLFVGDDRCYYISIIQEVLRESIGWYCCDVPAHAYDFDVSDIIEECSYEDENGNHINADEAINILENEVKDAVEKDIYILLGKLPDDIYTDSMNPSRQFITVDGAYNIVMSYLQSDYYDEEAYYSYKEEQFMDDKMLDDIFDH